MRIVGTATVAACVLAGAAAAGVVVAGPAAADVVADKARTVTTDDGWSLTVTKTAESIDRAPSLDADPFTHEGFVSLKAVAEIGGKGAGPVTAANVSYGYQIGCQVDVSSGLTVGLGFSIGPNASVNISYPPSVSIGGNASVSPNISTTVKPGGITTVTFGSKPLQAMKATAAADQVEIKVSACAGPVSLRSFATATISTPAEDHSTTAYGDPLWL
ncbi:MspA family porin [Nocardia terpenica]|uniref:MspA family porin n=1 Tax=Nocardia terpenica TaxID=455432 RepID=UPI0018942924|nr:MspA family porin [Nocardia terpenica]MBF6061530.1 MspA family porin [Nocardia terpenica]MBF6105241.1 MspA family porin [Nocardia terpenica]MBF6113289.1 MspA family porin [Nocardia terpenica]MBF6119419.1 MspA family porin [Nocardia terpenica]MBF6153067.1 MspA family porin [Nocardia terpenica]